MQRDFSPQHNRAQGPCLSAIRPNHKRFAKRRMEDSKAGKRVMGIEPTWPAWKAGALPLSYTREVIIIDYPEQANYDWRSECNESVWQSQPQLVDGKAK